MWLFIHAWHKKEKEWEGGGLSGGMKGSERERDRMGEMAEEVGRGLSILFDS